MSRIAIGIWRGCVSTTLDFASSLLLIDMAEGKTGAREEICIKSAPPQSIAMRLEQMGVGVVICGAISRWLTQNLEMRGIRVIPFVTGDAEEVFQAFANGTLDNRKFLMAGCLPDARGAWRCRRRKGNPHRI